MTLAPTLDLADAASRPWDVVVVGAGPAGAMAARELARRGTSVLLVDKAPFPRWKVCGSCLNRRALATLNSVGLGKLVAECRAVPLADVHLAARGRWARVPLPGGAALSRERFDAALVEAAIQVGATFLPGTRAVLGGATSRERRVLLRQKERATAVSTRLVLAADGLGGRLLEHEAACETSVESGSRIGAGVIVDAAPAFYEAGTIFMACGVGGYVGLVRLEDGRLDIAAALDPAWIKRVGRPDRAVATLLDEIGWPRVPQLDELAWRGTLGLTRRASCLASQRVLVLGDAAGYVEPFTGEGIAWALASAVAVTPLAARAIRRWEPTLAAEWTNAYRKTVVRRQYACRVTAKVLRHPVLTRALIGMLTYVPGLAVPFVRHLNATSTAKVPRL